MPTKTNIPSKRAKPKSPALLSIWCGTYGVPKLPKLHKGVNKTVQGKPPHTYLRPKKYTNYRRGHVNPTHPPSSIGGKIANWVKTFCCLSLLTGKKKYDERPHVNLFFNKIEVSCLYDSGAQRSLIDKKVFRKCFPNEPRTRLEKLRVEISCCCPSRIIMMLPK